MSGFGDLKGNMGEKHLHSLANNLLTSLELTDDPQNDTALETLMKSFREKYVKG
jgi:hypothetical protein